MPEIAEVSAALVARILPPEEWSRLTQPELQSLDPAHSLVVVVERGGPGGEILGEFGAFTVIHVEGLWSAEPGNAGIARALASCMVEALIQTGVREVLHQVTTPEIEALSTSLGGRRVPGDTWVIPITS